MSVFSSASAPARRLWVWALVVSLLLGAFVMRVWDLTDAPPGIDADEMYYAMDATRVAQNGQFQIYYDTNYGHEPLFIFLEAAMFRLLGYHAFSMRYTTVICGMLALAGAYAMANRMFSRRVALATLVFYATIFWPVFLSRLAHRVSTFPMFTIFSMYTLWRALYGRSWRWAVAAGIVNGITFYVYVSSRVFPLVPVLWLAALLVLDRPAIRANWKRIALVAVMGGLIIAPLAIFIWRNPDVVNRRLYTMGGPFYQLQRGQISGTLTNLQRVAGMFTFKGDPDSRFNFNGRPVFDPVSGLLFYAGLVVAVIRWRRPAVVLLILWLGVMLMPTLLSPAAPSYVRADGAIFPVMALAGLGVDWVWGRVGRFVPPRLAVPKAVVLGACVLALGGNTLWVLFHDWRNLPEVMQTYESSLYLAARYMDQNKPPAGATVFVAAPAAADNAPIMFGLQSASAPKVHWTSDIVWPAAQGEVWYLFSAGDLPTAAERVWLGQPPTYREYNGAGETILEVYRLPAAPVAPEPAIRSAARANQLVDLLGVTYPQPFVRGQPAEAWLFFKVPETWVYDPHDLPNFRVRLSSRGLVWSDGAAWWSYPPGTWQAGDIWIQRVKFTVPADMPPQAIQPELVIFNRQQTWTIIGEGEQEGRLAFALPPVEVTGQPVTAMATNVKASFGGVLALLSASVPRQGMPGVSVGVKTTWQALRDPDQDYTEQLQLIGPDGGVAAEATAGLWQGVYPTHVWRAGEQVTSNDVVPVSATLAAGVYQVRLRLADAQGQPVGQPDWLTVGSVEIAGRPHVFTPPAVEVPLSAAFGDVAQLVGYRLNLDQARPGGSVKLTLIWQAVQPSASPLKVFVHLYGLDDTVNVLAQHDGEPAEAQAPTTGWLPGEYIEDEHVVSLDASLAAGDYRLHQSHRA